MEAPLGVGPGGYPDIECDKVTVAKRPLEGGRVEWTQYWGVMRRGSLSTLKLVKMPSRVTPRRAPGPAQKNSKMANFPLKKSFSSKL
eukprot:454366-Amphidinium_carterae.1